MKTSLVHIIFTSGQRIAAAVCFLLFAFLTIKTLAQNDSGAGLLQKRKDAISSALTQSPPVIRLSDGLSELQKSAQAIALNDSGFTSNMYDGITGKPLLNEVFGVYPARESDLPANSAYVQNRFFKVELYNYGYNSSSIAIVDLILKKVIRRAVFKETQPDIPDHLKQIGLYLATQATEVEDALGFKPEAGHALMAETKTALNNTRCERSMHLCVAPTFTYHERALWVIVDLTELKVAGIRWTYTGNEQEAVTERSLQNKNMLECFCEKDTVQIAGSWKFNYMLTSSDGLRISNVFFNDKKVIDQAKIVDWHVSYSNTDGFGYSDAVGCPVFSQSAVIAVEPPFIDTLYGETNNRIGYRLRQRYWSRGWPAPCNYQYEQRYEFYDDGSWRFAVASLGRGCGNNGIYRPVLRMVLSGEQQRFYQFTGTDTQWNIWDTESWNLQKELTLYSPEGYLYKMEVDDATGFYIEPGQGQFEDGGRGDFAFTYVTLHHDDLEEGDADLPTIGPCCNVDYRQGPEKFMEPLAEKIVNQKLVMWYVPQLRNDDTPGKEYCWAENYIEDGIVKTRIFPCFAGPLFIPIK